MSLVKLRPSEVDMYHHKGTDTMYISITSLLNILRKDKIDVDEAFKKLVGIDVEQYKDVLNKYIDTFIERIESIKII